MNILFLGDITGKAGRRAVKELLPRLKQKYAADLCIANAENAAGGFGITYDISQELFSYGINIITMGNHVWDNKETEKFIDNEQKMVRPLNYPPGNPGRGLITINVKEKKITIMNLSGRVFVGNYDCPFRTISEEINKLKGVDSIIIVDFHAEATSEKIAMGWFLDGRVSAMIGTHTHVQTADETILPLGTAYITDVGMTGPHDSVIGIRKELALKKFITKMPVKFEMADSDIRLSALFIEINNQNNKAEKIVRIQEKLSD